MKDRNDYPRDIANEPDQSGFSLVELLIVLVIIAIVGGFSSFYFSAHQKLFLPDEQAIKLVDLFQEARQRSLTQRQPMRIEIDLTDNAARLINEKSATTVGDDFVIREIALSSPDSIKFDSKPANISLLPGDTTTLPAAQFKASIYPKSVAHRVCTFRFLQNGTVTDAGTNDVAANATVSGATLFVWAPQKSAQGDASIARAISVNGTSGMIRMWEYDWKLPDVNKWKDSRRTGAYR